MMYTTAALFASCAALVVAAPAPAPVAAAQPGAVVTVGLGHRYAPRANGEVDGPRFLAALNHTLAKYNAPQLLPSLSAASLAGRAVGKLPLVDQVSDGEDVLYYGNAIVGATTPQTFTTDFDTGSADFFVPGPQCTTQAGCVGNVKYDQGGRAEGNTTSVTYGSGAVKGANYYDTVSVAGLVAPDTNVVSLTSAQGFSNSASAGLMGMAFSTIANSKQPTFFERLMALKKVSANEFSFYLGRSQSGTAGNSEMVLGGRNTAKFTGSVASHKVTNKSYWLIALAGFKYNGKAVASTAGQAVIDTGTTLIIAPTAAAKALFAQIPGARAMPLLSGGGTTLYGYPCNTKAIPSLTFDGVDYAINPLDFNFGTISSGLFETFRELAAAGGGGIIGQFFGQIGQIFGGLFGGIFGGGNGGGSSSGPTCLAGIAGGDLSPNTPLFVVGDVFLKNWYSIYNYDNGASVSFAKAV